MQRPQIGDETALSPCVADPGHTHRVIFPSGKLCFSFRKAVLPIAASCLPPPADQHTCWVSGGDAVASGPNPDQLRYWACDEEYTTACQAAGRPSPPGSVWKFTQSHESQSSRLKPDQQVRFTKRSVQTSSSAAPSPVSTFATDRHSLLSAPGLSLEGSPSVFGVVTMQNPTRLTAVSVCFAATSKQSGR